MALEASSFQGLLRWDQILEILKNLITSDSQMREYVLRIVEMHI